MTVIPHKVKGNGKDNICGISGKESKVKDGDILRRDPSICYETHDILKKIWINFDISPITKIVIENDRKMKTTLLRIR